MNTPTANYNLLMFFIGANLNNGLFGLQEHKTQSNNFFYVTCKIIEIVDYFVYFSLESFFNNIYGKLGALL